MVKQRRGLGVAHVLEPVQVLVGDFSERRRPVGITLDRRSALPQPALDLAHQPILGDDRRVLVEIAGLRPATTTPVAVRPVALEPRAPEPALHRPKVTVGVAMAPSAS